jgi:hypothetical protein
MNRQKERKLAEAQDAQRKELLAQLSLLRGSLISFKGDKGSTQYQNRIKKINIVEKALLNNPSISLQQKEIAGKETPFLYSRDTDQVILKGDLFFSYGTPFEITGLNFKKREFTGKPLREIKQNYYSPYAPGMDSYAVISAVKMKSADNFTYYPQPSREEKKYIPLIDTEKFYRIKDGAFKEKHYGRHLEECSHNDFSPIQFFNYRDGGKLTLQNHGSYNTDDDGKPVQALNPFNKADREKIEAAIKEGIEYDNEYRQESYFETIGGTLPELHRLIVKAAAREEGREVAEAGPLPKENTPENFRENLIDLGRRPLYRNDVMAAAQYLIRTADPYDKELLKGKLVSLGCTGPESTRKILSAWIQEPDIPRSITPGAPAMGR